jgi:STE24 endopeptidase
MTWPGIDPQRQKKAKEYARIRRRLFVVDLALGAFVMLVLLLGGVSLWLKGQILAMTTSIPLAVALYFVVFAAGYGALTFPLSIYSGFVLPHRYGLSTQTLPAWLADQAKGALLALGFGLVGIEVVYYLLRAFPQGWWLLTGAFILLFTVVLSNLAPILIVPLFFKLTPLEDQELAQRLMALAERARTSVRGVFTINLSSKTTAANAALMGLGNTRRIVLGDTLYQHYSPNEIETILAHELGHHVHGDLGKGIVVQTALTLVGLYLAHLVLRWGVGFFGLEGLADIAAFPLLGLVLGAFALVTMPLSNGYSRWREAAADEYALQATLNPEAFISAMAKLANQNLADVAPEPWVEFLFYSHPPLGKRMARGERFKEEMALQQSRSAFGL